MSVDIAAGSDRPGARLAGWGTTSNVAGKVGGKPNFDDLSRDEAAAQALAVTHAPPAEISVDAPDCSVSKSQPSTCLMFDLGKPAVSFEFTPAVSNQVPLSRPSCRSYERHQFPDSGLEIGVIHVEFGYRVSRGTVEQARSRGRGQATAPDLTAKVPLR